MRIYDISNRINSAEVYPGDPITQIQAFCDFNQNDLYHVSSLSMSLHTGTHVDAPYHVLPSGKRVDELDLEKFIGECYVQAFFDDVITGEDIDRVFVPGTKRLLIKGYGKARLSESAAFALVSEGVELIGIDAPTIGTQQEDYAVHKQFLLSGVPILENLCLGEPQTGKYFLYAPPLKIESVEAAPCRALLFRET